MKMKLTDIIIIRENDKRFIPLKELCHLSKNVFNATLYMIRQHYFNTKKYLSYYDVDKTFKSEHNVDYYSLPYVQSAQQTMRIVDKSFKSFFVCVKSDKVKKARIPKYKDKDGVFEVVYTNQCFKVKDNVIKLKINKSEHIFLKANHTDINQVRIVPRGNHIKIEIIYEKEYDLYDDNSRYASVDLGLNNICSLASNCAQSILYDGKRLKSINAYWNKKRASLQSKLNKNRHINRRISHLNYRRNNMIKDYMHKLSRKIVDYCVSNDINTLIVGKNKKWKDSINIGRVNNQNFVSIPHSMLISMLSYKCALCGLNFNVVEEAYTSKCSFIDNEEVCKHESYSGKRMKRGLFITKMGQKMNADVNAAFNIMKKFKCNCDASILMPADKRFVYNPVRIFI